MDDKVLNAIGKLTIEINDIKDGLKNKTDNANYLQRIEDVEKKVSAFGVQLEKMAKDVNAVVLASNDFAEKLKSLDDEWQENRELVIAERKRRAKLSKTHGASYKIKDEVGLGGRLRALRRKKNVYVAQLSKETLIPESTIGSIENFRLKIIAKEYIESLNKFFDYDFSEYVETERNE